MNQPSGPMTRAQERQQIQQREKRIKIIASAVVALVLVVLVGVLAAVQQQNVAGQGIEAEGQALSQTGAGADAGAGSGAKATAGGVRTVTDSSGRQVEIPADPQSIAVMDPFSGEFAVMIGAGEQLCGIPNGVRGDAILKQIFPAMETDTVATSGSSINIETLLAQECDLAVVKSTMDSSELAKLTRMGIPYVVVGYTSVAEQLEAMRLVGQLCGGQAEARAAELIGAYEDIIDTVQTRVAAIPEDERVLVYHSINAVTLTDAQGSIGADWIALAGCRCATEAMAPTSGTDATASLETIYTLNPSLIVCNAYTATDELLTDAKWQGLPAVQQGAVKTLPVGASRWGQRGDVETALAVLWLAKECYPDQMADVDLKGTVQEIYGNYLGVEVDDQLYETICSGQGLREQGSGNGGGE